MDAKTLMQVLNTYETLIQDGEIQFLYYQKNPIPPEDVGRGQRTLISLWEEQMRENVPKSQNPEVLRKRLLNRIEREKKYGNFRDSHEEFAFLETNLVFQVTYGMGNPGEPWTQYAYRLEQNFLSQNYPSLEHLRFFVGGGQRNQFSNRSKVLRQVPPNQFDNEILTGYLERLDQHHLYAPQAIIMASHLPNFPSFSEKHNNEVQFTKNDMGEPIYLITHINSTSDLKIKIYVRLKNGLPEVFQHEVYHRDESPHTDTEEYSLLYLRMYREFEWVPALNITFPKVHEEKGFRSDGFMRRHTILTITEMDFNLGLPTDFFDWDESELTDDEGRRKRIRGDVQKKDTDKETTE